MNSRLLRFAAGSFAVSLALFALTSGAKYLSRGAREARETKRYVPPEVVKEDPKAAAPVEPLGSLEAVEFRSEIEREVFRLTNEERIRHGARAVAWHDVAAKAARFQSRCLSKHRLLGHDTVPCGSLRGRLELFEVPFAGAENLDFIELPGPVDKVLLRGKPVSVPGGPPVEKVLAAAIVQDWMESPHHRENLLDKEQTDLGVGVYWAETRIYATQVFLRKVDCGVVGQFCCPGPGEVRYCYHPYACNVGTDMCEKASPVPTPVLTP